MESLLGDNEVSSSHTIITTQNSYNFWSDRWIATNFLQEFPEAVFFGVAMKLLLSDDGVWSGQARIMAQKGNNFDLTVGSLKTFYESFWRPIALE